MALFLSTYENKVDRKGRVSVPASFRTVLTGQDFYGVILFRSNRHTCLEGFGWNAMAEMGERLDHFDLFSEDQDDLATAIFGDAVQLPIDGDGRILLPDELRGFAGIEDQAAFVGMGKKFQVWAPETFAARRAEARGNVQGKSLTLPAGKEG